MFDISWTDPQRETVAQRRNRKQNQTRGLPPESSSRASSSVESELRYRPGILTLFDGNTKRLGAGQESLRLESTSPQTDYSRTISTEASSNFPLTPDSIIHGPSASPSFSFPFSTDALKSPLKSPPFVIDCDTSPSNTAGFDFSAWTGSSTPTESTDSFTDESTSSWFLIQPLGPRSYVSQTTEITSLPQESVAESESLSTVSVRIFAETCEDAEEDPPTRRPSIFDAPLQDHDRPRNRPRENADYLQFKPPQSLSTIRSRENLWTPPDTWNSMGSPTSAPQVVSEEPSLSEHNFAF